MHCTQSKTKTAAPMIAKSIDLFEEETMRQASASPEILRKKKPLRQAMRLLLALGVTAFMLVPQESARRSPVPPMFRERLPTQPEQSFPMPVWH